MELSETIIAHYPGLGVFLTDESWQRPFAAATLARSRTYANSRFVTRIQQIEPVGKELLRVQARIKGSRISFYNTLLLFHFRDHRWKVEPECACPVGYLCKHACAFLRVLTADLEEYEN